jgi:hypothetical protein
MSVFVGSPYSARCTLLHAGRRGEVSLGITVAERGRGKEEDKEGKSG